LPFGHPGKIYGAVLPYARLVISVLAASMAVTVDPPVKSGTWIGYDNHSSSNNTIRSHHRGRGPICQHPLLLLQMRIGVLRASRLTLATTLPIINSSHQWQEDLYTAQIVIRRIRHEVPAAPGMEGREIRSTCRCRLVRHAGSVDEHRSCLQADQSVEYHSSNRGGGTALRRRGSLPTCSNNFVKVCGLTVPALSVRI
jgi:hypothetical protein